MEGPTLATLINCTGQLLVLDASLESPLPKFWPLANLSGPSLESNNLSAATVLSLLSPLLQSEDLSVPVERKNALRHFLTECLFPAQARPFALPWWQKLVWAVVFAAMLSVAVGGNAIVMWIVLAHRRMRTVTNYFLVNLSVSDLLMALLNCIFNFIFMLDSDWPFGNVYCTVNNFVANVSVAASVFTLVAISLDRYVAILSPLKHRMSKRRARVMVTVIWLASMLLAIPCLLYSTTKTLEYANGETRTVCYMAWPDGRYPFSMQEYVYNLIFLTLTYLLPVAAMAVCYTVMGRELWGSRSIGELTQRQVESIRSKRKVVRMFILVVSIFAFCWLPYHGYFIYAYHNNDIVAASYVQHVYLAFYWLAMSNAMVNPVIYYWMNNRFRVYFQRIICECCCLKCERRRATPPIDEGVPRRSNLTSTKRGCRSLNSPPHSRSDPRASEPVPECRATVHWRRRTQETHISGRYQAANNGNNNGSRSHSSSHNSHNGDCEKGS